MQKGCVFLVGFPCHIKDIAHNRDSSSHSVNTDVGYCTKSLRDSFGLTTFVRLEGILWCAALDRTRHTVRLPPLTWSLDERTLFLSEEHINTIPIAHKPCHSAAPMLSLLCLPPLWSSSVQAMLSAVLRA